MPNSTLVNLVRCTILNTGTGTLQLGAALPAFRGVEALTDGETYSYSIQQGSNFETGQGVYSQSDGTLTRGVIESSAGNAAVSLSPNAVCAFPALDIDFQIPGPPGADGAPGAPGDPGPTGPNGLGINMPITVSNVGYTMGSADANTYIRFNSLTGVNFTIAPNSDAPIAIASVIAIEQANAGQVTLVAGAGVTLHSRDDAFSTFAQYSVMQIKKVDTDTWTVLGDVA